MSGACEKINRGYLIATVTSHFFPSSVTTVVWYNISRKRGKNACADSSGR